MRIRLGPVPGKGVLMLVMLVMACAGGCARADGAYGHARIAPVGTTFLQGQNKAVSRDGRP